MTYSTETFDAVVALTRTLRPRWDVPGIRQAIRDALARDVQPSLAELTYAVIRVAENFAVESPAVIPMDGPHWRQPQREALPPSAIDCAKCGRTHMPSVDCVAEGWKRRKEDDTAASLEAAREELAAITADRCHHGTPRRFCVCRETKEEDSQ